MRDEVLLLVGFRRALRRSELATLTVDQISPHERGLVIALPVEDQPAREAGRAGGTAVRAPARPLPGHHAAQLFTAARSPRPGPAQGQQKATG
jgi:hypothetical protein